MNRELEPFLTPAVTNAIIAHMREEEPKECCGSITLADGEYTYTRHENVNVKPEQHFSFDKATNAKIMRSKSIVAYVHSHTDGSIEPSKHDMEVQVKANKPSVIATTNPKSGAVSVFSFGNHLLDYPLDGRPWHYGVFDCLEAVRGEMYQRTGIILPQAPRVNEWWLTSNPDVPEGDRNMYEDNFRRYGYEEFTPNLGDSTSEYHPKIGDLLLMQINSPVAINHAAVYVGENLIYQHRAFRQSGRTPLGYMMDIGTIRKWVRHPGKAA